jgi:hypothetical protein
MQQNIKKGYPKKIKLKVLGVWELPGRRRIYYV